MQALAITVTDVFDGNPPPPPPGPNPGPTPPPDPNPGPTPPPNPTPNPGPPTGGPSPGPRYVGPGIGPDASVLVDQGLEEEEMTEPSHEVINVMDLPPLLRPASWGTTTDQIRAYYPDPREMMQAELSPEILQQLNQFSDELGQTMEDQVGERSWFVKAFQGAGLTVSTGVLAWMVRGGAFVTSLLASLPAWRQFDPVPILNMDKKAKKTWRRRVKKEAKLEGHEHKKLDQIF